jgi:uracil-DNA glycosylase family 4
MPTPYEQLIEDWKGCTRCELHRGRNQVVFGRGSLPADVVFVGEAPGESEDTLGQPFKGPAGLDTRVGLDRIIRNSVPSHLRWAIFNLVGCIPRNSDLQGKADEPPAESVIACSPRLERFIQIASPRLIVAVGRHAEIALEPGYTHSVKIPREIRRIAIRHPAWCLRQSTHVRDQETLRSEVSIRNTIEEVWSGSWQPGPAHSEADIPF